MYFIRKLISLLFPANRALIKENERLRRLYLEARGDQCAARNYLARYGVRIYSDGNPGTKLRPVADMVREFALKGASLKICRNSAFGQLGALPLNQTHGFEEEGDAMPDFLRRKEFRGRKVASYSIPSARDSILVQMFKKELGMAFDLAWAGDRQRMNIAGDAIGGDE